MEPSSFATRLAAAALAVVRVLRHSGSDMMGYGRFWLRYLAV